MADPLPPERIEVRAVQFVGTNVEMTYRVDAPEDEAEARLDALLGSKLGLYALTRTGLEDGRVRFSVMASPLDRLFHKIGPTTALTVIKHASVTIDLSDANLSRQGQGLARSYPPPGESTAEGAAAGAAAGAAEVWRPWDAGKLLGTLLRTPALLNFGPVRVAGVEVAAGTYLHAILPLLDAHVAEHGGVRVEMPPELHAALAG